jgi:hypothetical protein
MPSFTRGDNAESSFSRNSSEVGFSKSIDRVGLSSARLREEAAVGDVGGDFLEGEDGSTEASRSITELRKRISSFIDSRGRVKSAYFTDEGGRLKVPYGSMFENSAGSPTAITLTTAGTWYGWVSAGDDVTYGAPYISFSGNATADRLLIGSDGDGVWEVQVSVDGDQGAAQAHLLTAAIFVNDAQDLSLTGSTQYTATQQVQPIPISGFVKVNAGDYLDLRFKSDTNSRAFDLYHCNVSMKRVCYQ